ncbi:hypothetical protein HDU93_002954 [Gonapodya sp. JEL0774]|nr:hypothetical protein HDU93_002954 [Gonapodya sp. JEL0774]
MNTGSRPPSRMKPPPAPTRKASAKADGARQRGIDSPLRPSSAASSSSSIEGRDLFDEQRKRDSIKFRAARQQALSSFFSVRVEPREVVFADVDVDVEGGQDEGVLAPRSSDDEEALNADSAPTHVRLLTLSNFSRRTVKLAVAPQQLNPHFALRDPNDTSKPFPTGTFSLAPGTTARLAIAFSLSVLSQPRRVGGGPLALNSIASSSVSVAASRFGMSLGSLNHMESLGSNVTSSSMAKGVFETRVVVDILSPVGKLEIPVKATLARAVVSVPPVLDLGVMVADQVVSADLVVTNDGAKEASCVVGCNEGTNNDDDQNLVVSFQTDTFTVPARQGTVAAPEDLHVKTPSTYRLLPPIPDTAKSSSKLTPGQVTVALSIKSTSLGAFKKKLVLHIVERGGTARLTDLEVLVQATVVPHALRISVPGTDELLSVCWH